MPPHTPTLSGKQEGDTQTKSVKKRAQMGDSWLPFFCLVRSFGVGTGAGDREDRTKLTPSPRLRVGAGWWGGFCAGRHQAVTLRPHGSQGSFRAGVLRTWEGWGDSHHLPWYFSFLLFTFPLSLVLFCFVLFFLLTSPFPSLLSSSSVLSPSYSFTLFFLFFPSSFYFSSVHL